MGMDAMREGKTWIIKNKFIVTEREHIHDEKDAPDLTTPEMRLYREISMARWSE